MKYPKLWNGASPVGEALVRALQRTNAPFLSSSTADGVTANKMGGRSEVFQGGGGGGFISRPTWGSYTAPQYYATGSGPYTQFKPIMKQGMSRAIPVYQARFGKAPNYGTVDWQGNGPDKVLSWRAWSWIGIAEDRYDSLFEQRLDRGFYDTEKTNVYFVQGNNFNTNTWSGKNRDFLTPTLRYQCVGEGLQVYRSMKLWREMREDQRISQYEFIQGAALSTHDERSGCFVITREVNIPSGNGFFNDGVTRAGWLDAEGGFTETHRMSAAEFMDNVTVQGWYFDRSGQRAVSVDNAGIAWEFSHANGFRILDPFTVDENFNLGRDSRGGQVLRLNRTAVPHPNYDYTGETLKKNDEGEYILTPWAVPAMRWDFNGTNWPHFTSRALGCDLRAGALLVIEHTFSPEQGAYYAPFVGDPEQSMAGTNKSVVLAANVVLYLHGEEVLRHPIVV
jgi:hypothetical protein